MIPTLSIVGHSNSGKTTLIERLIVELKRRGRRLAVVKHTGGAFDMDRPGKDTWRYAEAGCDAIAILGPDRSAVLERRGRGYPYEGLLAYVGVEMDLMLIEGLHSGPARKIEVHRAELGRELRCKPAELAAVVTDEPLSVECPQLAPDEIGAIADLIEQEIAEQPSGGAALLVNGQPVSLGSFTRRIITGTITGLLGSLKGIGSIKTISVSIRTGGDTERTD